jgi:hypothetical protein
MNRPHWKRSQREGQGAVLQQKVGRSQAWGWQNKDDLYLDHLDIVVL